MKQVRLDKWISDTAGISRTMSRQAIRKGQVRVNGQVQTRPESKADPESDRVVFDGIPLTYAAHHYLMMHKPAGLVSATEDPVEKTVIDLVREPVRGLFPVGRLDKDTEGLLLLTNDGGLAHRLLSPRRHVDKCYYARLDRPVGEDEIRLFAQGLDIGDEKVTLPAVLEPSDQEPDGVLITIREGRYHQIKRMARAVGRKVLYLKRLSMGSLSLDPALMPGEYRPLTEEELDKLLTDGDR
ncbi:MAG: rRNA pseudouridine synthase [Eubacterium sp.]|nr:rRNA pseudouridine synthase [Eubacterium sp.]